VAIVTGAIKSLTRETKTDWSENTRALLYDPSVRKGDQLERFVND